MKKKMKFLKQTKVINLLLLIIFLFKASHSKFHHKCQHDHIQKNQEVHKEKEHPERFLQQEYEPIRITTDFSNIDSLDSNMKQTLIEIT
jgi:hypothetical protein